MALFKITNYRPWNPRRSCLVSPLPVSPRMYGLNFSVNCESSCNNPFLCGGRLVSVKTGRKSVCELLHVHKNKILHCVSLLPHAHMCSICIKNIRKTIKWTMFGKIQVIPGLIWNTPTVDASIYKNILRIFVYLKTM